ncbi:MAG: helix-turn-helix domain-containing protein [Defluviitaleaceae bacterium]|nr:helix-turn-helix domain-containing protein [Defluviitaleaceae bacterium]
MDDTLHINIGLRVAKRRRALGLTREALAAMAQPPMSSKYLWEIENARKRLSADMLHRLATALRVSSDWLLGSPPPAKKVDDDGNDVEESEEEKFSHAHERQELQGEYC